MNENLNDLIEKAKNNDKKALDDLLKIIETKIKNRLYILDCNKFEISDLSQEVLLKLYKKINTLNQNEKFESWLNKIISNTFYDYLRKKKKETKHVDFNIDLQDFLKDTKSKDIPQIDIILNNELKSVISNSINNLPQIYKVPLKLREFEGLSYSKISNKMELSLPTVKSRIKRARKIVQQKINEYQKN